MSWLLACAVCFGDAGSQNAQNAGIFVLLGVTGVVLGGFVAMGIYFWLRARRLAQVPEGLPEIG